MNELKEKYYIALGNLQNMAIDNTKGSKGVDICVSYINEYITYLQSKIFNANLFKLFLQERLLELKDNIDRGVADFDARNECEYILEQFIYFLKEDKDETNNNN